MRLFQFQDSDLLCFAASSALTVVRWLRPWMLKPWPQHALGCPRMPQELQGSPGHSTQFGQAAAAGRGLSSLLIHILLLSSTLFSRIHTAFSSIHMETRRYSQVFTGAWDYFRFLAFSEAVALGCSTRCLRLQRHHSAPCCRGSETPLESWNFTLWIPLVNMT